MHGGPPNGSGYSSERIRAPQGNEDTNTKVQILHLLSLSSPQVVFLKTGQAILGSESAGRALTFTVTTIDAVTHFLSGTLFVDP